MAFLRTVKNTLSQNILWPCCKAVGSVICRDWLWATRTFISTAGINPRPPLALPWSSETERAEHYLPCAAVEIPLVHDWNDASRGKHEAAQSKTSPGSRLRVPAGLRDALVGYQSGHRGAVLPKVLTGSESLSIGFQLEKTF